MTLLVTCLIVAALLGLVNGVTAGPIAEINQQKTEQAMLAVVADPDNTTFSDPLEVSAAMTDAASAAGGTLGAVYEAQVGGASAGYAVTVSASGSQGTIEMMVGVDAEGAVTGVSIVSHSETSGIGTKVVGNGAHRLRRGACWTSSWAKERRGRHTDRRHQCGRPSPAPPCPPEGVTTGVNAALAAVAAMG